MEKILLILLVWWPYNLIDGQPISQFVAWNVGQGQFASLINNQSCIHFDMGGEKNRFPKIALKLCKNKTNIILLSHSDFDHINYIPIFQRIAKNICLFKAPPDQPRNSVFYAQIPLCNSHNKNIKILSVTPVPINKNQSNQNGRMYFVNSILFTGDIPKELEHNLFKMPLKSVRFYLAGHHGSKTSSGEPLLDQLPRSVVAIISARKARYGHPHPLVEQRLRAKKIPSLLTEHWGHLIFEL